MQPTTTTPNPLDLNSFNSTQVGPAPQYQAKSGAKRVWIGLGITFGVLLTLAITAVMVYRYYFHAHITTTELSSKEKTVLNDKLAKIEAANETAANQALAANLPADPVEMNSVKLLPPVDQEQLRAQQEEFLRQQEMDRRTLTLSSRELNGMLNYNTDLGKNLQINFKHGYMDIQCVVPVDSDVAIIGGKTLRGSVDVKIDKTPDGKIALVVRDVTVCGVPLPNAWLGDLKGKNLLEEFGTDNEILMAFANGIEDIAFVDGEMRVRLAQ